MEDWFREFDDVDYEEIEKARKEYVHPVHGKIVEYFMDSYNDGVIYEDGYREITYHYSD